MGRLIFFLLLAAVGYAFWRWVKGQQQGDGGNAPRGRADRRTEEAMVRCDVCGLNVPQSEAVGDNGRWFCGDDHRRKSSAS